MLIESKKNQKTLSVKTKFISILEFQMDMFEMVPELH